ncbi:MAG: DUF1521 domain-containing protein [Myxococcaceae bacterium]|nr:DUF1521 domain-containing protein [Myxococcaceae bacterium]
MRIANLPQTRTNAATANQTPTAPPGTGGPANTPAATNTTATANARSVSAKFSFEFSMSFDLNSLKKLDGNVSHSNPGSGVLADPTNPSSSNSAATGGLTKDPAGFPAGSVRTPGGYTIVPRGKDAQWDVFKPGQKADETPMSKIFGDPHVHESDGTKWDFTKTSTFRLPDGTAIGVNTTSEVGQSVSRKLDIVNGDDHVTIDGINTDKPTTSAVTPGGERMMEELGQRQDQFVLGNSTADQDVRWLRARNGEVEGLITGSTQDAQKTYDQTIQRTDESGMPFQVQNGQTAEPGSDAFSEQLKQMLTQLFEGLFGRLLGGQGANDAPAAEQTVDAAPVNNTRPGTAPTGTNAANAADDALNPLPDNANQTDAAATAQQPDVNTDMMQTIEGLQQLLDAVKSLFQLFDQLGSLSQNRRQPMAV